MGINWKTPQDKINEIEDIIVNQYEQEDEPFTVEELRSILDSLISVLEGK